MPTEVSAASESLLRHPRVQELIHRENAGMRARRLHRTAVCPVFEAPVTALEACDQYSFEVDREAARSLPDLIDNPVQKVVAVAEPDRENRERYARPRRIGIVFSGGPAPGGHNVIAGIFDAARRADPGNRIFGFLQGPDGIIDNEAVELNAEMVDAYRNMGGFTMIRTGRTKIDTDEKMRLSRETCRNLGLDALVVVGGDDSNTNAAFLAQEMLADGVQVIGVPKTIDGDIQVRDADGKVLCAMSFGFHTAARAFSREIANLCTDCSSDVKYWHICKVMGRVASHLALEVALQSHANLTLIGEELADYVDEARLAASPPGETDYNAFGLTLRHLSRVVCDAIVRRAAVGKSYGVIVIPEGVLEFINEIQVFIIKLNTIIADWNRTHDLDFHLSHPRLEDKLEYLRRLVRGIGPKLKNIWNARDDELFNDLPEFFREGLLTERDSHGNFQFSQVPTEKVIMGMVRDYLDILREKGRYKVGIDEGRYRSLMARAGLDADRFGPVLFRNYGREPFLLMHPGIISKKTLRQALVDGGIIGADGALPPVVAQLFEQSVPRFKTQTHFYGYNGRGNHPTGFDCTYTYNLGQTVFALVANGATGQMAAIRNLELGFDRWEPIGIPIAPLMRLEERKGRLALVLEKSLVDIDSAAFRLFHAFREDWLAATPGPDQYRRPGPIRFAEAGVEEERPIILTFNSLADNR